MILGCLSFRKKCINPAMMPARFVSKLVGAFGLLSLVFVNEAHTSEPMKPSATQAPSLKELKNASYSGIEGLKSPIKLVNGGWKGRPYKKGSASRPVINLVGDLRVIGDLTG